MVDWKGLNWDGLYEISNRGRGRSLDRTVRYSDGRTGLWHGKILTPVLVSRYLRFNLCRDGRQAPRQVHLLVLWAFAGPPPEPGQIGRHGPGGQLDNRWPENLCWGTWEQNAGPDRVRDGTSNRGEQNGGAKLTAAIVLECRRRRAAGELIKDLAIEYGVDKSSMSMAISGVNWGWL